MFNISTILPQSLSWLSFSRPCFLTTNSKPQQSPAIGSSPGENDELVYSGGGSDCDIDDEDQCVPVFETGSGEGSGQCKLDILT